MRDHNIRLGVNIDGDYLSFSASSLFTSFNYTYISAKKERISAICGRISMR